MRWEAAWSSAHQRHSSPPWDMSIIIITIMISFIHLKVILSCLLKAGMTHRHVTSHNTGAPGVLLWFLHSEMFLKQTLFKICVRDFYLTCWNGNSYKWRHKRTDFLYSCWTHVRWRGRWVNTCYDITPHVSAHIWLLQSSLDFLFLFPVLTKSWKPGETCNSFILPFLFLLVIVVLVGRNMEMYQNVQQSINQSINLMLYKKLASQIWS